MAIVKNFWLKKQSKKLAGMVLYQAMGQTRSRELAENVTNPRTTSQMTQRVKWANLVNLYRANRGWMKYAFETKKTNQSEYNKFMSLNVSSSQIYLTKQAAAAGGCIVDGYLVTQGSLPSIEITKDGLVFKTNIFFGDSTPLNNTTTIGAFTTSLLLANPAMRQGDQLSFIRFSQQVNAVTGIPYVVVREYELILDSTSTGLVKDYLPLDYLTRYTGGSQDMLAVTDSGLAGGFTLVLSRTTGGRTYVSTQRIIVANNDALIAANSSAAALQAAIASYGESEDAFLSTTSANEAQAAELPLSILSVKVDNTTYIPGNEYQLSSGWDGSSMEVTFSEPIEAVTPEVSGSFAMRGGGRTVVGPETGTVTGNKATFSLSSDWDIDSGSFLSKIVVSLAGVDYEATFDASGAQGGLD